MTDEMVKRARSLQHSTIPSVSEISKAYLELAEEYKILRKKYILEVSKRVMKTHHKTLKRLSD